MKAHRFEKLIRPDSKGRICLGSFAKGISGFKMKVDEETHQIFLSPYVEIPLQEQWLVNNQDALKSVQKGIAQSKKRETVKKGTFKQYIDEES